MPQQDMVYMLDLVKSTIISINVGKYTMKYAIARM